MPFEFAFAMPADERLAWIFAVARLDGLEFDTQARRWCPIAATGVNGDGRGQ